ncbi:MAG: hypothetical protein K8R99_12235 [Actinomycetia bacterium]|nr:hypothetical protein [Actinomycetes bacterium]
MPPIIDPAGWMLIVVTLILASRWKVFAFDPKVRAIVLVAVLLRTLYSVANVAAGPLFGLGVDAQEFHRAAVAFLNGGGIPGGPFSGYMYSAVIGVIYRLTGGGLLLGQQLSVLAVVLTAASSVRIMRRLSVQPSRIKWALAALLFFPAGVVFTSGLLREAFEQLVFVLILELALRLIDRPQSRTVVALITTVALGGLLHRALAVAGLVVAAASTLIALSIRRPLRADRAGSPLRIVPVVLALVAIGGLSLPRLKLPYGVGPNTLAAASEYRLGAEPSRADYLRFRPGYTIGLIDVPVVVGLYTISPLPWQVESPADVVTALESAMRLVLVALLAFALIHVSRASSREFLRVFLLAGGWLTLELIWSVGTSNWGTATRHHLVGFPILLIVTTLAPPLFGRGPHSSQLLESRVISRS